MRVLLMAAVVFAAFLAATLGARPGMAQSVAGASLPGAEKGVIATDHIRAELVVRNARTAPGETTDIAISHTLAPGWHTYWVNPGDVGEPPVIDFDLPEGGQAGEVRFPTPDRLPYPPLVNFGYKDAFTLLTSVTVPEDWPVGEPYRVPVRVDWLVCEAICIPEGGATDIVIETGTESTPDSTVAFTFVRAGWAMPGTLDAPVTYTRADGVIALDLPFELGEGAFFFPAERGLIDNVAEQTLARQADGTTLTMEAGRARLDGEVRGILKVGDQADWITATGPADPPQDDDVAVVAATLPAPISNSGGGFGAGSGSGAPLSLSIWQAMLFAFLGGAILNLMPCVFPVLALKVFGLIAHADAPLRTRATIGAAYTSGILTSFAVLAAVLLTLKSAGVAVGWGFQLQSPLFVAAMAAVVLAIGLNLSGVFEVGASMSRLGGKGPQDGPAGSFMTGVLATIVATPCTAPFMAVAVGAALVASPELALAVFAAMGLGLAAPFALLALIPGLSRVMPRPGPWMARLREALAFPLYATAAWLIWVLAQLTGSEALLAALAALVMVGVAAWLIGITQRGGALPGRVVAASFALVFFLGAVAAVIRVADAPGAAALASTPANGKGEPYSALALAEYEAAGDPVFLNATAAWCISCKVNEAVVFETAAFSDLLEATGTKMLVADWTRRDDEVTALLARFGRAGVPLYVYFPTYGEPEVLPQVLTVAMLTDRFSADPKVAGR